MENKKQATLKDLYKRCFDFVAESKKYIYSVVFLFILLSIIGFFITPTKEIELLLLQKLKEIADVFTGLGVFETIWMIFSNNLYVSFISILLGVLFGIFPLLTSLINGYIVGFVANRAVSFEGIGVLWRLLPHGIFELPAVLISMGIGLRLGMCLFYKTNKLKELAKNSLLVFLLVITPLLIIAAIIEGLLIFYIK